MLVTYDDLVKKLKWQPWLGQSCVEKQLALFRSLFPNGAEWPRDAVQAYEAGLDIFWFISSFGDSEEFEFTDDPRILKLRASCHGWTVAHKQAAKGWKTDNVDILKLSSDNGWTVAHELSYWGVTFRDEEILQWKDVTGKTVANARTGEC